MFAFFGQNFVIGRDGCRSLPSLSAKSSKSVHTSLCRNIFLGGCHFAGTLPELFCRNLQELAGTLQELCSNFSSILSFCQNYSGTSAELVGTCRNFAGTLQKLCQNFARTLQELWRNYGGTLPELCRNSAGTLKELCRNSAGTLPEHCCSTHSKFIKIHKRLVDSDGESIRL